MRKPGCAAGRKFRQLILTVRTGVIRIEIIRTGIVRLEIVRLERKLHMGDSGKKQVPLRLSAKLYDAIAAWAEDDFRSVNGQIEYLLTECVRQRKKNGRYVSDEIDVPPELDI